MKKIRVIQNAATFVSDLKVEEIEVLQKQNPMALAIEEHLSHNGYKSSLRKVAIYNLDNSSFVSVLVSIQ